MASHWHLAIGQLYWRTFPREIANKVAIRNAKAGSDFCKLLAAFDNTARQTTENWNLFEL